MSDNQTYVMTALLLLIPLSIFGFLGYLAWTWLVRKPKEMETLAAREREAREARRAQALPSTAKVVLSEPVSKREIVDQHGFGQYRDVRLTLDVARPEGMVGPPRFGVVVVWDVQVTALPVGWIMGAVRRCRRRFPMTSLQTGRAPFVTHPAFQKSWRSRVGSYRRVYIGSPSR